MRLFFAASLLVLLAACTSFGPSTPSAPHTLDPLTDDLDHLLIAFDLPRGLAPLPGASSLSFGATGSQPVIVRLAEADADEVAGNLPAPDTGRAYYLFGLSSADQAVIGVAQDAAREARATASLGIVPRLCSSGPIDPQQVTISVLAAVPGGGRATPLIDHRVLADVLAGAKLPACR